MQTVTPDSPTKVEGEIFKACASGVAVEKYDGGKCLAFMNAVGNWADYSLDVMEAGDYSIAFNASNERALIEDTMRIFVNGTEVPDICVDVPQTGDGKSSEWYNFINLDPVTVPLPAGAVMPRLQCKSGSFGNIEYFVINKVATPLAQMLRTADRFGGDIQPVSVNPVENGKIMLLDVYNDPDLMPDSLAQLSNQQLANMPVGQSATVDSGTGGIGNLMEFGVPNAQTADGSAGLRLSVKTTAWPCSTALASSFGDCG